MALVPIKRAADFPDPKSHLTHFCHRYCQRAIAHGEVEYLTYQLGEQYQCIVILKCIKGNAFPGRISGNQKQAEWSAAEQALKAFSSLTEMVLLPIVKESLDLRHPARKFQAKAAAETRPEVNQAPHVRAPPVGSPPVAAPLAAPGIKQVPLDAKTRFNSLVGRIRGRALVKDEIRYSTWSVSAKNGYQASVTLDNAQWNGKVCGSEKEAEQSAAAVAVETLAQEAFRPTSPYRKLLCQDFRGHCAKGIRCPFFHQDLAAPSLEIVKQAWLEPETRATSEASQPSSDADEPAEAGAAPVVTPDEDLDPFKPLEPLQWSVKDVVAWVMQVDGGACAMYANLFEEKQVNGLALSKQTASTLKELGVQALGRRKVLFAAIEELFH